MVSCAVKGEPIIERGLLSVLKCTSALFFSFCFISFLFFGLAVGKTSLITRFMYDSFDHTYQVSGLSNLKYGLRGSI